MSVFLLNEHNEPVRGVHSFHQIHPDKKLITIRLQCSSQNFGQQVLKHIIDGDYDIQLVLIFNHLNQNSQNRFPIISHYFRTISMKTIADQNNHNPIYIQKQQINSFVSIYLINLIQMISNTNSSLAVGLDKQFNRFIQLS